VEEKVNVAEAKRRFSELLARAAYKGERFIITRRGKPMAALVDLHQLEPTENHASPSGIAAGLLGAAGALAEGEDLEEIMREVVRARQSRTPRPVTLH